jgi:hypothetical protein
MSVFVSDVRVIRVKDVRTYVWGLRQIFEQKEDDEDDNGYT